MSVPLTKTEFEARIKLRLLFRDRILKKLNPNSDIIMFHCPWDLLVVDHEKPIILYEHLAGRAQTFMFEEAVKHMDPIKAEVVKKDRAQIMEIFKKLYKEADLILTNSRFIQRQMKKWFGVKTSVCNPAIDLDVFKPVPNPTRDYFLSAQRVHWQKRIEIQIAAFQGLKERLLIVGGPNDTVPNPDLVYLAKGHRNIKVVAGVSKHKLVKLMANAKATIQTGYQEDFGLVPIQSLACGTPAIVVDEGGFRETIHSLDLGIIIKRPYIQNLRKAVLEFEPSRYMPKVLLEESKKYGFDRFRKEMNKYSELAVRLHALRR